MGNTRRKSPAESKIATFFEKSAKTTSAYVEHESKPWFDVECCDAEDSQIDNYIDSRFQEFNDAELLNFLKGNSKFRDIVSDIRKVYVKTSERRRKAA